MLGGVGGSWHFPLLSTNRLDKTEPATFAILLFFFRISFFLILDSRKKQRAVTQRSGEFIFLCTTLLHYEIYRPAIFLVSILNSFGLMLRTRKHGRMEIGTDKQSVDYNICYPFQYVLNQYHKWINTKA